MLGAARIRHIRLRRVTARGQVVAARRGSDRLAPGAFGAASLFRTDRARRHGGAARIQEVRLRRTTADAEAALCAAAAT
jgi:hypothetical protein